MAAASMGLKNANNNECGRGKSVEKRQTKIKKIREM
jgi:hypothetical protein